MRSPAEKYLIYSKTCLNQQPQRWVFLFFFVPVAWILFFLWEILLSMMLDCSSWRPASIERGLCWFFEVSPKGWSEMAARLFLFSAFLALLALVRADDQQGSICFFRDFRILSSWNKEWCFSFPLLLRFHQHRLRDTRKLQLYGWYNRAQVCFWCRVHRYRWNQGCTCIVRAHKQNIREAIQESKKFSWRKQKLLHHKTIRGWGTKVLDPSEIHVWQLW